MNESMKERPVHFLLVEDDDDHAALVERALRENRVVNSMKRASDGEEAIRYLTDGNTPRPDVILLDLNLPRKSGHEVLAEVKSNPALRTIPIVVLTTSQAEADRERAYNAHANSYLVKPLDFSCFHELIHDLKLYWAIWNEPPGKTE
ncbi:MAG: response regulator [Phycisphaerales bacterium]